MYSTMSARWLRLLYDHDSPHLQALTSRQVHNLASVSCLLATASRLDKVDSTVSSVG